MKNIDTQIDVNNTADNSNCARCLGDYCLRRCIDVNNMKWKIIFSIYRSRSSVVIDPSMSMTRDSRGAVCG